MLLDALTTRGYSTDPFTWLAFIDNEIFLLSMYPPTVSLPAWSYILCIPYIYKGASGWVEIEL